MKLCFGVKEFALVTGLSCFGSVYKKRYSRTENNFMSRYFRDTNHEYISN
ncbi:hypothetical protein DCAR_0101389 [Daucus carota subsp. sativus]|uniref:Uncharacterized protein n=1 Tax=Daucus carota subsp. sativus TaxID=79200 RepID=A0AAF0W391_DAUCS|nr:hypothetical protein DCAR_0101389 [Daucus carota subsp. sativus]